MLDNVLMWLLGLVKDKLNELFSEVIEGILEYIDDENALDEYVNSLPPMKKMVAESIINFVKSLMEKLLEMESNEEN